MGQATRVPEIDYFYNEKGDYTITHYDNPIAFAPDEESAMKIKDSFNCIKMRVDALSKIVERMNSAIDKSLDLIERKDHFIIHFDCTEEQWLESLKTEIQKAKL